MTIEGEGLATCLLLVAIDMESLSPSYVLFGNFHKISWYPGSTWIWIWNHWESKVPKYSVVDLVHLLVRQMPEAVSVY